MTIIGTAHNNDARHGPLYQAVSAAYDRWQQIEQPASHILEGRIARGRVWCGTHPQDAAAAELLAQLRDQLKLSRWEEGIPGSDAWLVVAAWEAARVEYEVAEERYLHAVGGHRVEGEGR